MIFPGIGTALSVFSRNTRSGGPRSSPHSLEQERTRRRIWISSDDVQELSEWLTRLSEIEQSLPPPALGESMKRLPPSPLSMNGIFDR